MDTPTNADLFRIIQAWVAGNYDGDFATRVVLQLNSGGKPIALPMKRCVCEPTKPAPAAKAVGNRHSEDYRSCTWNGEFYEFTVLRAAAIKMLWEAMDEGCPSVSGAAILEKIESDAESLRDLFRGHPAWGTMIVSPGKGMYKLAD